MTDLYITLILLSFACAHEFISSDQADILKLNNELRQRLSQEQRNAECCRKKMRCCKQRLDPPDIEIRAILVRCPRNPCNTDTVTRHFRQPLFQRHEESLRNFQGFDEDEPLANAEVRKCRKKLLVTMKIRNAGPTNCKNVFVVVDHVYDPVTSTSARLLNPYVIKIKQEPITEMYKLRFQHVVNSEAKEVVYNKHSGNYTGCDTTSSTPTCGAVKFFGKILPYSTGFCCSCDALVNSKRQPDSGMSNSIIGYTDPSNILEKVQCPRHVMGNENRENLNQDEKTIDDFSETLEEPKVPRLAEDTNDFNLENITGVAINGIDIMLPAIKLSEQSTQDEPVGIEGVIMSDPFSRNVFIRKIRDEDDDEESSPTGEELKQKVDELERLLNDQLELDSEAARKALGCLLRVFWFY